jgi:phosphoribosylglycinamide formyltransferase-1
MTRRVAILISGRGSNMASLIRSAEELGSAAEIALVLSNRPDAAGLHAARQLGIPTHVVDHDGYGTRDAFDAAMDAALRQHRIDLICLAGFMRILTDRFVKGWAGRMINIHPSLLPLYRGTKTHRRALEDGVLVHGCTVHFVVPELDAGPIIAQAAVPVLPTDTEESLSARVLEQEHLIYPLAMQRVCAGSVRLDGGKTVFAATWSATAALQSPGVESPALPVC